MFSANIAISIIVSPLESLFIFPPHSLFPELNEFC